MFPINPVIGDSHIEQNKTFVYNGEGWVLQSNLILPDDSKWEDSGLHIIPKLNKHIPSSIIDDLPEGGKIDIIKVNGVEQVIVNKSVDISVPSQTEIDTAIANANNAANTANNAAQTANTATATINATEQDIENAEAQRVANENTRIQAETIRNTSEISRANAEQLRATAESERVAAELIRIQNENERIALMGDLNTILDDINGEVI